MSETIVVRRIDAAANHGQGDAPPLFYTCIFKNWDLIHRLVTREIKARYESSMLGIFWAFFTPLTSLLIYSFVFGKIFHSQWRHNGQIVPGIFPIIVLCGLTLYNLFSESMSSCARIIAGHVNYVKKVVFPLEVLPVASLLSALFFCIIWFLITLIGVGVTLHRIYLSSICLPVLLLPVLLFTLGLCWVTASLGVYIRDVPHAVTILLLIMLYLTGIFYSPDILPPAYQRIMYLNPLAVMVEQMRRILIFGEWPQWRGVGIILAASFVVAQLGYVWFVRTKKGFADVL